MRLYSYSAIASIVATFLAVGCGADTNKEGSIKVNNYTLTQSEMAVFNTLILEDLYYLADGNNSSDLLKKRMGDYAVTTPRQMQIDYEKNEVAGDKKYRNKIVFIAGKVKSIDRSIGESYYISLEGGSNPFMSPKSSIAEGYTDYLAGLAKGQTVRLACIGNGMLIGSAMLAKCEPLPNFISAKQRGLIKQIGSQLLLTDQDRELAQLFVISIAMAPHLSSKSACLSLSYEYPACTKEINTLTPGEMKSDIKTAATKLGLDWEKLYQKSVSEQK